MVSNSLCPLISFSYFSYSVIHFSHSLIRFSYSVHFSYLLISLSYSVGDNDLWYHHIGEFSPFFSFFFRSSCKDLIASWEGLGASWEAPGATWEGQLRGPERGGGVRKKENGAFVVCGSCSAGRALN